MTTANRMAMSMRWISKQSLFSSIEFISIFRAPNGTEEKLGEGGPFDEEDKSKVERGDKGTEDGLHGHQIGEQEDEERATARFVE